MILSGIGIQRNIGKNIIIDPFDKKRLNPNSYNLRLYNKLLIYDWREFLDIKKPHFTDELTIPESGLILKPNKLYLGRTVEYTETHGYVPMIEGRSSIGRLGMAIHITAGFGDVGFCGYWTLEIHCLDYIKIYPFIEVCQIYYHTIDGGYKPYTSGKYQNNKGIQPSFMWKEFK